MRLGWLFLLSFLLTLVVVPAFASVTYAPLTIETVRDNGVYTARPVSLDTAGFARTTGRVSTMGGRASFPVAVRASQAAASGILVGASRLIPAAMVAMAAYDFYQWLKSSPGHLQQCTSDTQQWCVVDSPTAPPAALTGMMHENGYSAYITPDPATCLPGFSGEAWFIVGEKMPSYYNVFASKPSNSTVCYATSTSGSERPATATDWARTGIAPMAAIAAAWPTLAGDKDLPVDAWTMDNRSASWIGDAYQGADGQWRRDALIVNPSNSVFPPVVRVENRTFGPVPDPNLLTLPTPLPDTPQDPSQPQLDLCAINPDIIACAQQEDYYSRMQSGTSGAVSSAAMTQQQFEESDKSFGEAIDAVGSGAPPDNSISGADSANDDLDGIVANIDSVDLPGLANIDTPSYSQCKTISFEYQSTTFLFPTASQCEKIEQIKQAFGYFLAGLVLVSLVWQLLTRPQG